MHKTTVSKEYKSIDIRLINSTSLIDDDGGRKSSLLPIKQGQTKSLLQPPDGKEYTDTGFDRSEVALEPLLKKRKYAEEDDLKPDQLPQQNWDVFTINQNSFRAKFAHIAELIKSTLKEGYLSNRDKALIMELANKAASHRVTHDEFADNPKKYGVPPYLCGRFTKSTLSNWFCSKNFDPNGPDRFLSLQGQVQAIKGFLQTDKTVNGYTSKKEYGIKRDTLSVALNNLGLNTRGCIIGGEVHGRLTPNEFITWLAMLGLDENGLSF